MRWPALAWGHGMASGLVDCAMGITGNCACEAAHGWLGRLLPQELPGRAVLASLHRTSKVSSGMASDSWPMPGTRVHGVASDASSS
jgi:hypothetical protein